MYITLINYASIDLLDSAFCLLVIQLFMGLEQETLLHQFVIQGATFSLLIYNCSKSKK